MGRLQVQTSSGWMDIGNPLVTITGGYWDAGTVLPMKGLTGVIRITTTIAKAGECTRDIGTVRITTMAAGETMIMIATIMIATTTDHYALFFENSVPVSWFTCTRLCVVFAPSHKRQTITG
jgi:hypothetical protein